MWGGGAAMIEELKANINKDLFDHFQRPKLPVPQRSLVLLTRFFPSPHQGSYTSEKKISNQNDLIPLRFITLIYL